MTVRELNLVYSPKSVVPLNLFSIPSLRMPILVMPWPVEGRSFYSVRNCIGLKSFRLIARRGKVDTGQSEGFHRLESGRI